ncbi:MAG: S26 family signal peptidase [Bacteroidales bacterium]|nr:S26 family signal peptidase [Bacteroidales bacterium]
MANNKRIDRYAFKYNYYFMVGENFYHSEDSRYWGFVPDVNIIGKAVVILFSKGGDGCRWKRLFKRIK